MHSGRKSILAATIASHALTHVAEMTFPSTALLVTMEFFGQRGEYARIGLATFIATLLFGVSALPSGWLVDRLGPRRVLLIFLFGTGACLAGLGFAPSFAVFTAGLAGVGLFSGLYHPAGATMISLGLEKHGSAMGAHGMGGNIGLAVTPFMAAALGEALGWRAAYLVLGLMPLLLGLLVLTAGIDVSGQEGGGHDPEDSRARQQETRTGLLVLLFAMAVFNGMTYRGLMTFLPAYFAESVRLSWLPMQQVTVGGAMTTAILLLGVAGQFVGGNLADRVNKEKLFTSIFFITSPIMLVAGMTADLALVLVTGLFAFLYFANQPVGNSILPRYSSARVRGMVFGSFFFVNFGAGSIMSWIAGEVGELYRLSSIFAVFSACLLVSALLGLALVRKSKDLA